ncbi:hypothetical protein Taro_017776 [Colocasia esculenta]|uniref:JAB1/MPN/MOV34 metalloenzyme domain-containing protein n=1 Tax=Colocasia esculenta TaxID=4460 RepID=A0A843UP06_COLES|nr:hypothetical protein [Colocasia esculenta]
MASASGSGLTFKLHPLVIVNISDHYIRIKSQAQHHQLATDQASSNGGASASSASSVPPPRVFGCVIGVQRGRTVEIFNSFELVYDPISQILDRAYLEKKQELCKAPSFFLVTMGRMTEEMLSSKGCKLHREDIPAGIDKLTGQESLDMEPGMPKPLAKDLQRLGRLHKYHMLGSVFFGSSKQSHADVLRMWEKRAQQEMVSWVRRGVAV